MSDWNIAYRSFHTRMSDIVILLLPWDREDSPSTDNRYPGRI